MCSVQQALQEQVRVANLLHAEMSQPGFPAQAAGAGETKWRKQMNSLPETVLVCDVCQMEFRAPMGKSRRPRFGGGYYLPDFEFLTTYRGEDVEDLVIGTVCEKCMSTISNRTRIAISELRKKGTNGK